MSEYAKPLPKPSVISLPFWQGAKRHELMLQHCEACGAYIHYPRPRCPQCFSDRIEWRRASGRGVVYSYTIVRRASSRAFADAAYVLAIVELAEGPHLTTNIVGAADQVRVGTPVEVFFDDVTPEHTLVKFKPA
jgi:uncharacterized OB-fold protein